MRPRRTRSRASTRSGASPARSMTHQLAPDRQHVPFEVEAYVAGNAMDGVTVDRAALDTVVRNFHALRGLHRVPVKLGHDTAQPDGHTDRSLAARLAFGWVDDVRRNG